MNPPIPFPTPADTRDANEKLTDARCALACLENVLCHIPPAPNGDLHSLDPENLAGFLRLILAQLPTD